MSVRITRIHPVLKPFNPQGALETFLAFRQALGLRKATLDLDVAILSPFIRENPDLLERPRLAALEYLASSKTEWTRQTRLKVLRVFFGYLLDEEILTQDPLRGIKGTTPPKISDLPSLEDVKAFLDRLDTRQFAQKRLKSMLMLALDSGLRRGELCSLLLRDLDLALLSVTIRASVSKNKKSREVPFSPATGREIRSFLSCRPPEWRTENVFPSETGQPLRPAGLGLHLHRLSLQFGIPLHAHALRHLCATEFLRSTGNLALTARLLGHSNIRVTSDFYEHLSYEDLRDAHHEASVIERLSSKEKRLRRFPLLKNKKG
jgi:integrase/recombinase XerD